MCVGLTWTVSREKTDFSIQTVAMAPSCPPVLERGSFSLLLSPLSCVGVWLQPAVIHSSAEACCLSVHGLLFQGKDGVED